MGSSVLFHNLPQPLQTETLALALGAEAAADLDARLEIVWNAAGTHLISILVYHWKYIVFDIVQNYTGTISMQKQIKH